MTVRLRIDGEWTSVPAGTSVASAVWARAKAFRTSVSGEPRAPLCGMGACFECRVVLDGQPNQRSCQLPARDGMDVRTVSEPGEVPASLEDAPRSSLEVLAPLDVEVVVVGAGPAGIAAAVRAGEAGRSVALIDDNPAAGGQIWRLAAGQVPPGARHWLGRLQALPRLTQLAGAAVIDASGPRDLQIVQDDAGKRSIRSIRTVRAESLVLATGARELLLPFPGWTLPGVVGAGGLQALIKSGLDVAGKRVVVAGSGPLLLAVADLARKSGADVCLLAEQAPLRELARFGAGLLRHPAKLLQAAGLGARLLRVPKRFGTWSTVAEGDGRLERVTLSNGYTVACDLLACGFGLVPEVSLARHLGLDLAGAAIEVDDEQQTSRAGIFAAGECTGVGGVDLALVEGQIAGLASAGQPLDARLFGRRTAERRFARAVAAAFTPNQALRQLPDGDTLLCRCEDVAWRRLRDYAPGDARRAKLETRCGMGPCQGRVCGAALGFLLGFDADRVRPPLFPVTLDAWLLDSSQPTENAND